MNVQENIQRLKDAEISLNDHCMCAALHDNGSTIRVIYPAGDWPQNLDGIQGSYGRQLSKYELIGKLLTRMESDWLNSFPGKI